MLLMLGWSRRNTTCMTEKRVWPKKKKSGWAQPLLPWFSHFSGFFVLVVAPLTATHYSSLPSTAELLFMMPIYMNGKHFISSTTKRYRFLTHRGRWECELKWNCMTLLHVRLWVCASTSPHMTMVVLCIVDFFIFLERMSLSSRCCCWCRFGSFCFTPILYLFRKWQKVWAPWQTYFTVLGRIEFFGSHTLNGNQTKRHEGKQADGRASSTTYSTQQTHIRYIIYFEYSLNKHFDFNHTNYGAKGQLFLVLILSHSFSLRVYLLIFENGKIEIGFYSAFFLISFHFYFNLYIFFFVFVSALDNIVG